jgi:L-lysine exporter family protein LysE/ArgO
VGTTSRRATPARTALLSVILTCLALTWLNPHVYLDTVFLLGTVASTHGDARWLFAAGAIAASLIWFFGLAFGARLLSRWLSTPRAWRILDGVIAVVMIALGVSLVLPTAG